LHLDIEQHKVAIQKYINTKQNVPAVVKRIRAKAVMRPMIWAAAARNSIPLR
jgi:hypothetical protein